MQRCAILVALLAGRVAAQSDKEWVFQWRIWNADTDAVVATYSTTAYPDRTDFAVTFDLAEHSMDPEDVNIECRANAKAPKVELYLNRNPNINPTPTRTESVEPFTLFGDNAATGNIRAGTLEMGTHTVWCVPVMTGGDRTVPHKITITLEGEDPAPPEDPEDPEDPPADGTPGFNANPTCLTTPLEGGRFCGEEDIIVIEAEDFPLLPEDEIYWERTNNISGALGGCYRLYLGPNDFGTPGRRGKTEVEFMAANEGEYTFKMRSFIAMGDLKSEHNDVWVRILDHKNRPLLWLWASDNKVAKQDDIDYNIYWPKGPLKRGAYVPSGVAIPPADVLAENSTVRRPHGAPSKDSAFADPGWVKVYRHDPIGFWDWKSRVGDFQGFDLKVYLQTDTVYTMQISGRSIGHAVDRFILHTDALKRKDVELPEEDDTATVPPKSPLCA